MPGRIARAAKAIESRLPKRKLRVVEVGGGCNVRPMMAIDAALLHEKKLISIDRSPEAAAVARYPHIGRRPDMASFAKKVDFRQGYAEKMQLKDGEADILMNVDFWDGYLVENGNFSKLNEHLREAHRAIGKEGFLIVAGHRVPGHIETPEDAKQILERHKFEIVHLDKDIVVARPRK